MTRVRLEGNSRNTRENAIQVAKLLGDQCKQPWLLVTSASHMVRSMEEFEAVECNVRLIPLTFGQVTGGTGQITPSRVVWLNGRRPYMNGWAFMSIALPVEIPIQDGGLVDPLHIAHDRICFSPSTFDHDLWQAGAMLQQILCATDAHGVAADSFDNGLTQAGFPRQFFVNARNSAFAQALGNQA